MYLKAYRDLVASKLISKYNFLQRNLNEGTLHGYTVYSQKIWVIK